MEYANKLVALPGATLSMRQSSLMAGGDEEMTIDLPVPCFLIEHRKGLVLFDTGCNPKVASDPEGYWGPSAKFLHPRFTPDDAVDAQIRQHGYRPEDVTHVVVSHLHLDHAGGMSLFPQAEFVIMKGELPYAYWPEPRLRAAFILEDLLPTRRFKWNELDGDTDLFGDGSLKVLSTPGHTPGECSLMVRLRSEALILTGDTIHIRPQLENATPMPSGYDLDQAAASIRRLKKIQDSREALLWIGHDPGDWASYPHSIE